MSRSTVGDCESTLRALLGPGGVLTMPQEVEPYLVDWRRSVRGTAAFVARPRNVAEVASAVRHCVEAGLTIVPQGGNTGLAAGGVPLSDAEGQVVLSLSRMSAIRSLDPIGLTMEVEAGCVLKTAQEAATAAGKLLPISLAAEGSAQIGGVISTNAGGTNVLRYGMTRQLVLGLEVVLSNGEIVDGLRHLRKDNAGYDWKQLFIGSEGTLGVVTSAVLRLVPQPTHRATALLACPSPKAALMLLARSQDTLGETITAFELISAFSFGLVAKHFKRALPIDAAPWFVLLEVSSSLGGIREAMEEMLAEAFEANEATDGVIAETEAQRLSIWALREHITEAEQREGRSFKHDVSVPVSGIPAFLDAATAALAPEHPHARVNAFGHMGDGNIHFNVIVPDSTDGGSINRTVHDLVARFDGSISAEHGIGQYRTTELSRYRTATEIALMRRVKVALDPGSRLNPGKILI